METIQNSVDERKRQVFDWEDADIKDAVVKFSGMKTNTDAKRMTLKGAINHLIKKGLEAEGFKSVA